MIVRHGLRLGPLGPLGRLSTYSKRVWDHFENPRNMGSLDKSRHDVGTGLVGAPACGDVMQIQVQVVDGVVVDARFKTFGCGSAIASSSLATEWIKGRTVDEACAVTDSSIASFLKLPPVKRHCSLLAQEGIQKALDDLAQKKARALADKSVTK
jgi:Fe-S cluster assembly scaffold IscU